MKIAEKILAGMSILGFLLKLAHIPGGAMLSVLALGSLSVFYLIAAYFLFDPVKSVTVDGLLFRQTSAPRLVLSLLTGISLSVAVIGLLFKLMHWPGAAAMLLIGVFSLVPFAIVAGVKYSRAKDDFYKQLAVRCIAISCLSVVLFFV